MTRRRAVDHRRDRVLTDAELRALWHATENVTTYGFGSQVWLLLTAQRRERLASLKWCDIKDGIWTIATEDREKGSASSPAASPASRATCGRHASRRSTGRVSPI
jgi:integrase